MYTNTKCLQDLSPDALEKIKEQISEFRNINLNNCKNQKEQDVINKIFMQVDAELTYRINDTNVNKIKDLVIRNEFGVEILNKNEAFAFNLKKDGYKIDNACSNIQNKLNYELDEFKRNIHNSMRTLDGIKDPRIRTDNHNLSILISQLGEIEEKINRIINISRKYSRIAGDINPLIQVQHDLDNIFGGKSPEQIINNRNNPYLIERVSQKLNNRRNIEDLQTEMSVITNVATNIQQALYHEIRVDREQMLQKINEFSMDNNEFTKINIVVDELEGMISDHIKENLDRTKQEENGKEQNKQAEGETKFKKPNLDFFKQNESQHSKNESEFNRTAKDLEGIDFSVFEQIEKDDKNIQSSQPNKETYYTLEVGGNTVYLRADKDNNLQPASEEDAANGTIKDMNEFYNKVDTHESKEYVQEINDEHEYESAFK